MADHEGIAFWSQVGYTIRNLRRIRGMSVDKLAARVGVTRQQIIRIEAGTSGTPLARLYSIAEVFQVSLGDLIPSAKHEPGKKHNLVSALRSRGLSPEEIAKVLDYISLLESARGY